MFGDTRKVRLKSKLCLKNTVKNRNYGQKLKLFLKNEIMPQKNKILVNFFLISTSGILYFGSDLFMDFPVDRE